MTYLFLSLLTILAFYCDLNGQVIIWFCFLFLFCGISSLPFLILAVYIVFSFFLHFNLSVEIIENNKKKCSTIAQHFLTKWHMALAIGLSYWPRAVSLLLLRGFERVFHSLLCLFLFFCCCCWIVINWPQNTFNWQDIVRVKIALQMTVCCCALVNGKGN